MSETQAPEAGRFDAILDSIEITEAVTALPAAVRTLSPDELEEAGLPREFFTLSPAQKAAALRASREQRAVSPSDLGRIVPETTERVNETGGLPPEAVPSFGLGSDGGTPATDAKQDAADLDDTVPYGVSSDAPRSDEELDAERARFEAAEHDVADADADVQVADLPGEGESTS
jgi:hypothetical protein